MNFTKKIVIFFLLIGLSLNCNNFRRVTKSGYFNPSFRCLNGRGWKNRKKFRKYLKTWRLFKNLYNQKNIEIKQANIVIVGNSLVHAFSDALIQKEFPSFDIVGRGIGGDMSDLLLVRLEENVLSLNPETIVIEIGGNDLIQGKCLSFIKSNVIQIIEKIRLYNPDTKIIFSSVPPTKVYELNAISPIYNAFLSSLPSQFADVHYIDFWHEMMKKDKPIIKEQYSFDSIHFNEKGYHLWGKLLRPYLKND